MKSLIEKRIAQLATIVCTCAAIVTAGCGTEVGDACKTNFECSPYGDLICDTAQKDGYCTVKGCGLDSCVGGAVCIRFFPSSFALENCNPETEDAVDPSITPTNECTSDEICLSEGVCILRATEERFCMKECEKDSDCREGYECRTTGTKGAEAVVDLENPNIVQIHFCGQRL